MVLRFPDWFLVALEFGSVGFLKEGKTGVPGEKPLGAKERTNNKLNPHIDWNLGYVAGRQVLSPLRLPCFQRKNVTGGERYALEYQVRGRRLGLLREIEV